MLTSISTHRTKAAFRVSPLRGGEQLHRPQAIVRASNSIVWESSKVVLERLHFAEVTLVAVPTWGITNTRNCVEEP